MNDNVSGAKVIVEVVQRFSSTYTEAVAKCAAMVKIVDVNKTTLALYGAKTKQALIGELNKVLTQGSQPGFKEELIALSEGKTRFAIELENRTLTGDVMHARAILSVVPGCEDTLTRVLVSIIDLTERKAMETRLQQSERLAQIGQMAAIVGHDLRSPLQGITTATYLVRNASLSREELDAAVQVIDDCVERSNKILGDLLDYSREIHLDLTPIAPCEIIKSTLETVKLPETIGLLSLSQERPMITVGVEKMRRVFINLITNAVDAMPNGGTLTIESKESNGVMEFRISDTGTGMDKRIKENLWKPLQTTKQQGIGLGLPICKRIVDAHGGEITVESETGRGTTFLIRLPTNKPL